MTTPDNMDTAGNVMLTVSTEHNLLDTFNIYPTELQPY